MPTKRVPQIIECPACGELTTDDTCHCLKCDTDLDEYDIVPKTVPISWREWISDLLDFPVTPILWVVAFIWLFWGVIGGRGCS